MQTIAKRIEEDKDDELLKSNLRKQEDLSLIMNRLHNADNAFGTAQKRFATPRWKNDIRRGWKGDHTKLDKASKSLGEARAWTAKSRSREDKTFMACGIDAYQTASFARQIDPKAPFVITVLGKCMYFRHPMTRGPRADFVIETTYLTSTTPQWAQARTCTSAESYFRSAIHPTCGSAVHRHKPSRPIGLNWGSIRRSYCATTISKLPGTFGEAPLPRLAR